MVIAYINENISLDQITDICPNGDYEGMKIQKKYIQKKYEVRDNRVVYPSYEDDAEEHLIEDAEEGDIVITSTLVNFSRAHNGMLRTVRRLTEKGVRIITDYEDFDSVSDSGKALITAIPLLQKYSRNRNTERITRQREGVERAKEEGKYTTQGRKPLSPDDFDRFAVYYAAFMQNDITKMEFAQRLGVSRPTLDKLINIKKGEMG